jgi:hypothetical protein
VHVDLANELSSSGLVICANTPVCGEKCGGILLAGRVLGDRNNVLANVVLVFDVLMTHGVRVGVLFTDMSGAI